MKKKKTGLLLNAVLLISGLLLQGIFNSLSAQGIKPASILLSFNQTDSTKNCIAKVLSDSTPVEGTEVHLYVKSLFSLLPVGKVTATDANGLADIEFPTDLPGDKNGMLTLIAKIEKDEKYGNVQTESTVKWGAVVKSGPEHWNDRSLSASRERAPMTLVLVSTAIILVIWGTIFYLVFQLSKIKRASAPAKI